MPDCGNRSTITRLTKYPHSPKENASAQKELAKTKEIKETTNSPARPGGGELRSFARARSVIQKRQQKQKSVCITVYFTWEIKI